MIATLEVDHNLGYAGFSQACSDLVPVAVWKPSRCRQPVTFRSAELSDACAVRLAGPSGNCGWTVALTRRDWHGRLGSLTKEVENGVKKKEPKPAAKKSAAKKTVAANHRTLPARWAPTGWRGTLERNLRAEGYSAEEAPPPGGRRAPRRAPLPPWGSGEGRGGG